ncbi:S-layer homology domain-containing protein [Paenibacillus monticola]|uniref:S-layer homology domain-containing protein n=1 Tax=Paenibacillus monticola TaxID=2666075 RepID=UPI001E5E5BBC|nr:S-layer homology domain-containing protein [Paenibacillus monticola]
MKAKLPAQATAETLLPYSDAADASKWAQSSISDCLQSGIVTGRNESNLAPKAFITRAEVAAIVQRLLKKSELI